MSVGDETKITMSTGGRSATTTLGNLRKFTKELKQMSAGEQPSLDGKFATIVTVTMSVYYAPDGTPEKLSVGDTIHVSGEAEVVKAGMMRTEFGPRPFAAAKGLEGKVKFVKPKAS